MSTSTPSTPREWFEAALEQPPAQRVAWLQTHCTDPALHARVSGLLDAHGSGGGLLDAPVGAALDALTEPQAGAAAGLVGQRIADFRLVRLLGQGGMATVFLGEREGADFSQRVAVKLLRRGLYSELEQRLFRRERQALASLSHPGIARLIDGGVTEAGIPYLVMEFVDGVPLTQFAVERQLDLRARLRLFVAVCRAVEAAHQGLIVHRDLKPSNILVDMGGAVKLLDFGIAKLLDEDGERATRSSFVPLTPGYAAPEQFAGGNITTATDVYALGVLLHELLLGERPQDALPRRPSLRAAELPTDLWQLPAPRPALRAALRGDLDNVLLKALAAEPARRYAAAGALAEDMLRYLQAQPVTAHPPSRWYRTRKFVQRNRGGVAATAALLLGLIASLGLALWQARVAQLQARRAENVRDFLLEMFAAAKDQLPRAQRPTPDVLARAAARRIDTDTRLDALTRAEFLATLGAVSHTGSDYAQAQEYAERALRTLDEAGTAAPRLRLDLEIAGADALLALGRAAEADARLTLLLPALRAEDDAVAVRGLSVLAAVRVTRGAIDEALALAREASQRAERAFGTSAAASLHAALAPGDVLSNAQRHAEARPELEAALARWQAAGATPDRDYVASLQNLAASLHGLGDLAGCEQRLREALALARTIHEPPHERIADLLQSLGALASVRGQPEAAEPLLREAAAMFAQLFGRDHPQVIGAEAALGVLELDRARYAQAVDAFRQVTDACTRAALDKDPVCARSWQNLSFAYLKLQRLDEADAANARSVALRRALYGEQHPQYANALSGRASIRLLRGDAAEALALIDQALAIRTAAGQADTLDAATMLATRARALLQLGRAAEALPALERAEVLQQRLAPAEGQRRLGLLVTRSDVLTALAQPDPARAAAREALGLAEYKASLRAGDWERLQQRAGCAADQACPP